MHPALRSLDMANDLESLRSFNGLHKRGSMHSHQQFKTTKNNAKQNREKRNYSLLATMKNTLRTSKLFTNAGHIFHEDGQRPVIRPLIATVLNNTWMMQHLQRAQLGLQCLKLLAMSIITDYFSSSHI